MSNPRPVRYRCEIQSKVELDEDGVIGRARVLELSETGAFLEEGTTLREVQVGDGAMIGIPLPGGEPWVTHVRFAHTGTGRVELKTPRAEHVSVSVRGFGVEFDQLDETELERLRDFLELIDTR